MKRPLLLICFFIIGLVKAQIPTVQDCLGAIPVCDSIINIDWNYEGDGNFPNEVNKFNSCLGAGERNSIWFKIQIAESGLLGFNIIPSRDSADFDWAVFNLTNHPCSDIFNNHTLEVSCNYSGSIFPTPITGANGGTCTDPGYPIYPFYPQEEPMIPVLAGESYYLLITNFQNIIDSYIVDFSLGTCKIGDCLNLFGSLYLDENDNCVKDENESGVTNISLRLFDQERSYFTYSDDLGIYSFNFFEGGEMQLALLPSNPMYSMSCEDATYSLNIPQSVDIYEVPVIAINLLENTSVNNKINKSSFNVYPNPTIDFTTIHLDEQNKFVNMSIFDLSGKLVMQQNKIQSGHKFSLENFREGVYFIRLDDEKGWVKHKSLVKIK
jgi:hypothetical protein